jgi:hypothetical protein
VALRAEVAAVQRMPGLGPGVPAAELLDDQSADHDPGGTDRDGAVRDGVVGVLRQIDTLTAAVVEARSGMPLSSGVGRERPARS